MPPNDILLHTQIHTLLIRDVYGNKYRDLQANNMQRVRDLRTLSPNHGVYVFNPQGSRNPAQGTVQRVQEPEGTEDTKEATRQDPECMNSQKP